MRGDGAIFGHEAPRYVHYNSIFMSAGFRKKGAQVSSEFVGLSVEPKVRTKKPKSQRARRLQHGKRLSERL